MCTVVPWWILSHLVPLLHYQLEAVIGELEAAIGELEAVIGEQEVVIGQLDTRGGHKSFAIIGRPLVSVGHIWTVGSWWPILPQGGRFSFLSFLFVVDSFAL